MRNLYLLMVLLLALRSEAATTYYVAPAALGGNNANTGLSTNSPWLITKGVQHLTNGNWIMAFPGSYTNLGSYLDILYQTNTVGRATLKSIVPHGAILERSPFYGMGIAYSYGIDIDGFWIRSNTTYGIIGAFTNCTVKNCRIDWNPYEGIAANSGAELNWGNTFENNYIAFNGERTNSSGIYGHGIYWTGHNNIVRNNLVVSNWGASLHFYSGSAGTYMTNNQIYGNITGGHISGSVGTKSYQRGAVLYGSMYDGALAGPNYVWNNTFFDGISLSGGTWHGSNNVILGAFHDGAIIYTNTSPLNVTNLFDYCFSTNTINGPGTHNLISANTPITTLWPYWLSHGRPWLTSSNPAVGAGLPTALPLDWFGSAAAIHSDIGAIDYAATMAADTRNLSISPELYWTSLEVEEIGYPFDGYTPSTNAAPSSAYVSPALYTYAPSIFLGGLTNSFPRWLFE